jgi:hypothetical protein
MLPQSDPLRRQLVRIKSILAFHVPDGNPNEGAGAIVGIILLDYCVESLLKGIMTAGGAAIQNAEPRFQEVWKAAMGVVADPKFSIGGWELPFKPELSNLHKLRNGTQHADQVPSADDIARNRAIVEEFFSQTLKHCFGLESASLSLASLVQAPILRRLLESANRLHAAGKWERSTARSAIAVARLLDFAERRNRVHYSDQLYDVYRHRSVRSNERDQDLERAIETLAKAVKETREQISKQMLHIIGLSWRDYETFRRATPCILIILDGHADWTFNGDMNYGEKESKFSFEFALKNILRMEADGLIHEDSRPAAQNLADDAEDEQS